MDVVLDRVSGASGEVSGLLAARRDLARWQTGVARLHNVAPLVEGAMQRRPGTRFVLPLKNESEPGLLIDFEASASDSLMLVFNGGVMRALRDGGFVETAPGTPYELAVPFTAADLSRLRWAQSVDQIFIVGARAPKVLSRRGPTDWTIADLAVIEAPVRLQNVDAARRITASATTGAVTLTATVDLFLPGHVGSVWRFDEGDLSTIPAWKAIETGVSSGARRRNRGAVYEAQNAAADTGPNPPIHGEGDVSSGAGNTIWRFIHDASGFVRVTEVLTAREARGEVVKRLPDSVVSAGTQRWYEAAWSDVRGWPTSVALSDGCLVFARGDEIWNSKVNDLTSFDETQPEDGAWSVRLLSPDGRLVQIEWLQATGVLVVGARNGVWAVRAKDAFDRVTSTTVRAVPQSARGAGGASPIPVEGGAVYVGRSRRDAFFARFDTLGERIEISEITAFSRRALEGRAMQAVDLRDPHRIILFRMEAGDIRACTFVPEQDGIGWQRWSTDGVIEQIGAIQSADERQTELWMIVRRVVNGQTRRFVELMQPFFLAADEDAPTAAGSWFVDSGLSYEGAPTRTVSGLEHLEGRRVLVFADGDERAPRTVVNGAIELDAPASSIVVGLPIPWLIRTLPLDTQTQAGPTAPRFKRTGRVGLHVLESAGGLIGHVGGPPPAPIEGLGEPRAGLPRRLHSGVVRTTVPGANSRDAAIEISGDGALPFTLLGFYPAVSVGDM